MAMDADQISRSSTVDSYNPATSGVLRSVARRATCDPPDAYELDSDPARETIRGNSYISQASLTGSINAAVTWRHDPRFLPSRCSATVAL